MFIMLTNVRQRKSLNPDRIQAHDLPNTGWVLYPPSYTEPYSVLGHLLVSFCDTHIIQSYILLGSVMTNMYSTVRPYVPTGVKRDGDNVLYGDT